MISRGVNTHGIASAWQWALLSKDSRLYEFLLWPTLSMIEGYSRGLLGRKDSRVLLAKWATEIERNHGTRGTIALGVIGRGALGDEPTYRNVEELTDDVQLARGSSLA